MAVSDIRIVEAIETEKPDFDFENKIPEILGKLPPLDLRGIGKVDVVGYSRNSNEQEKISNLYAKDKGNPAYIELNVARILDLMPEDKRTDAEWLYANFVFAVAKAAGYNMIQFKHGIDKKKADGVAFGYARKQLAQICPGWKVENDIAVKE